MIAIQFQFYGKKVSGVFRAVLCKRCWLNRKSKKSRLAEPLNLLDDL